MSSSHIRIGFIGAGGVNFGSAEGPWDHASRLEKMENVSFVGISDPDTNRANSVLQKRLQGPYGHLYEKCQIRTSFVDMIEQDKPDAVFIGLPPHCHGLSEAPFNVECVCAEAGVHMFIEKPVSCYEPSRLQGTMKAIVEARNRGVITSVGYMFRYSKALDKMKEIIRQEAHKRGILEHGEHHVTTVMAKFNCAYSLIDKKSWWDVRSSGGPIVEQCTHVVDLIRYITESDCDKSTLNAFGIPYSNPNLGRLTDMASAEQDGTESIEDAVPEEYRVSRSTVAMWRQKCGTLCQLSHGVQLHGSKYEAEVEVWADGLRMSLEDPYAACRLTVRRSKDINNKNNGDVVETFDFGAYTSTESADLTADPYYNEVDCFIKAVRTGDHSLVRSSYEDAFQTYQLTWDIQNSVDKNRTVL
jgi:predicted dehydrogenase